MKTIKLALLVLMWVSLSFSQQTFRLGFAGDYPEYFTYGSSQTTSWSWYPELSANIWQGFGMSDKYPNMLDSCHKYGLLFAYFNPDTIIWTAFGKMSIIQAEDINDRFAYE